uniref:BTB domain-containing protein n=1 Tax=Heterorhabditis bacteriophora TaxID=37862 RepID=A0A1I7X4U4_HETBA
MVAPSSSLTNINLLIHNNDDLNDSKPSTSNVCLSQEEDSIYSIEQHAQITLDYFNELSKAGVFLDVRLESGGQYVAHAHRLILAAFSRNLETALSSVQHSTNATLDIDPRITGVSASELMEVLEYMYKGSCRASPQLKNAAESLGCLGLSELIDAAQDRLNVEICDTRHAIRLLDHLQRYRAEGMFFDCNINTQKMGLVRCHRLLLCAHSKHFETALLRTHTSNKVTMHIDSYAMKVSGLDVKNIVDFVYLGSVRGARRRFRLLRVSAFNLGVLRMVDIIDFHLQQEQAEEEETLQTNDIIYMDYWYFRDYEMIGDGGLGTSSATNDVAAQAADDYVSIYEEYVMGPRRGRRGGTYGRSRAQPLTIKGPAIMTMTVSTRKRSNQSTANCRLHGKAGCRCQSTVWRMLDKLSTTDTGVQGRKTSLGQNIHQMQLGKDTTFMSLQK